MYSGFLIKVGDYLHARPCVIGEKLWGRAQKSAFLVIIIRILTIIKAPARQPMTVTDNAKCMGKIFDNMSFSSFPHFKI